HVGRVACGHAALGVEGWRERKQSFKGCIGAGAFVDFEDDLLSLGLRAIRGSEADRHLNSFVRELASLYRGQSLLMTAQREFVRRFARDSETRGQPLRDRKSTRLNSSHQIISYA